MISNKMGPGWVGNFHYRICVFFHRVCLRVATDEAPGGGPFIPRYAGMWFLFKCCMQKVDLSFPETGPGLEGSPKVKQI